MATRRSTSEAAVGPAPTTAISRVGTEPAYVKVDLDGRDCVVAERPAPARRCRPGPETEERQCRTSRCHATCTSPSASTVPATTRRRGATRRRGPRELFTAGYWVDQVRRAEQGLLDFVSFDDEFGIQSGRRREVDTPHRPGPRPPRRRPAGVPGGTGDGAHRAPAGRHDDVPGAVPHRLRRLDAGLGEQGSRRLAAPRVRAPERRRRSSACARRPTRRPGCATCSTRPPTPSRSSAGCGTAGRTTRSSRTSPPAASSTATSCTTSTSRAASSASRGRRSCPARRRASRSSPCWRTSRSRSSSPPAAATSCSSRRRAPTTSPAGSPTSAAPRPPSGAAASRCGCSPTSSCTWRTRAGAAAARKAALDERAGFEHRSDAMSFTGTADELADLVVAWHDLGVEGFRLRPGRQRARPRRDRRRPRAAPAAPGGVPPGRPVRDAARAPRPRPARQPLREERMTVSDRPRKQIILGAHFPGVNNTSVWSDPAARSQVEFDSFVHLAQTAERGKFDFFFLAEGLRLREQRGKIHDLDVVGRPDTLAILSAVAAVTTHLGLAGTLNATYHEVYELARQLSHARPPLRRAGGLERRHVLGRLHRGELPPRRLPRLRRPLRPRRRVHPRGTRAVGLVGRRRARRRSRVGARSCAPAHRARSTSMASSSTSAATSRCRAARSATRSSCRPATARAGASWRRRRPTPSSRATRSWRPGRRSTRTSSRAWPATAARATS